MPPERSVAREPESEDWSGAAEDGERFVFGDEAIRERWLGRPLAETRWTLELGRMLADPVWRGVGVPRGDGRPVVLMPGFWPAIKRSWSSRRGCAGSAIGRGSAASSPTPGALTAPSTGSSGEWRRCGGRMDAVSR